MQTRPRERARGALVVDDDTQRRPRLLGNATGMGDVARIDRERPGEVVDPGAREHVRLDQRRHGKPTRTLLELETTELHTLVGLGVRPECDAELPSPRGHVREIALDDIQVEQEGRGFDLVDVHVSPSLFPFPVISRRGTPSAVAGSNASVCRPRARHPPLGPTAPAGCPIPAAAWWPGARSRTSCWGAGSRRRGRAPLPGGPTDR